MRKAKLGLLCRAAVYTEIAALRIYSNHHYRLGARKIVLALALVHVTRRARTDVNLSRQVALRLKCELLQSPGKGQRWPLPSLRFGRLFLPLRPCTHFSAFRDLAKSPNRVLTRLSVVLRFPRAIRPSTLLFLSWTISAPALLTVYPTKLGAGLVHAFLSFHLPFLFH